jgi:hypothetical protein
MPAFVTSGRAKAGGFREGTSGEKASFEGGTGIVVIAAIIEEDCDTNAMSAACAT